MGALLETVILLFYFYFIFIFIFGTLAGWDAFITAMLSDRSSAEDVCRVGGEKKNLLSGSLCSTFGFFHPISMQEVEHRCSL